MTAEQLIAELRQHSEAMTEAPWSIGALGWCVYSPAYTEREIAATQFASDASSIAWFGTHRAELLALIEKLHAACVRVCLEDDWCWVCMKLSCIHDDDCPLVGVEREWWIRTGEDTNE